MNKFIWLLRREVWETRAIWIAPAICAAIMIFGPLAGAIHTGTIRIDADIVGKINAELTPEKARGLATLALIAMGLPFLIAGLFTQFFYSLDTLYSERRDRSILFWRSMPVSDVATVLSKVTTAAVIIPMVAAIAMLLTEICVFAIASVKAPSVLPIVGYLWSPTMWGGWIVSAAFLTFASALWFLPAIGWYLLVSAWSPRSPFVFAVGTPLAIMFAERVVLGTTVFARAIASFYGGFGAHALSHGGGMLEINLQDNHLDVPANALDIVRPLQFFATPELWVYIALGAAMIAGAVWLRRYRDTAG